MSRRVVLLPLLCLTLALPTLTTPAQAQTISWAHQLGTSDFDALYSVDVLDGDVFAVGEVDAAPGGCDVLLQGYRGNGQPKWSSQIDTGGCDFAEGIATGGGSIYIGGGTGGSLTQAGNAGAFDAFVRSYTEDGGVSWTDQFGSAGNDFVRGAAATDKAVFVGGSVRAALPGQTHVGAADAFLRKYDASGNEEWTRQFGTAGIDAVRDVALVHGGIVVVGETAGALPGQAWLGGSDLFVRMFDPRGNTRWTRQFGTAGSEIAWGIDVAGNAIYVSGDVAGALPEQQFAGGPLDAFVRRYDAQGNEVWTEQFGTTGFDRAIRVATDGDHVAVVGRAGGSLSGQSYAGGATDPFVRLYDAEGSELWTRMFGSTLEPEAATGAAFDRKDGGLFVSGGVGGALSGETSQGFIDAFVMKFSL